jgi:hypothetical protein
MSPTLGRRRLLLALPLGAGLIGLGGCGFRPLYGGARGEAVAEELASVEVRAPLSRLGRTLQNQLIEDLNPAGLSVAKRYRLDVRLRQSRRALAIQLDDSVTRYDLTLAAFFTLGTMDGGEPAALEPAHEVDRRDDTRLALPDVAELEADEPLAAGAGDSGLGDSDLGDFDDSDLGGADDAARPGTLYRSAVRRVASYNVIGEPFATLIAEQDAERRAAVEVSREIRTLLTIFFENDTA